MFFLNPQTLTSHFSIFLQNDFGDTVVELSSDQVRQTKERHPDFNNWDRIAKVIENGDKTPIGRNYLTESDAAIYTLTEGKDTTVVVAAYDVGGKGRKSKPTRTVVLTAFRGNPKAVEHWVRQNKAAPSQRAEALQLNPIPQEDNPTGPQSDLSENISQMEDEINGLLGNGRSSSGRRTDLPRARNNGKNPQKLFQSAPVLNTPTFKKWFGDSHLLSSYAQRMAGPNQNPADLLRRMAVRAAGGETAGGLNQPPINDGLDMERQVSAVRSDGKFAGRQPHEITKGQGRSDLIKSIAGTFINDDQGWNIELKRSGAEHAISSALGKNDPMVHLEAVAKLPELIKTAVLVESHDDLKNQGGIKKIHRFFAPFDGGDGVYSVKMTVKEYSNGRRDVQIDDLRKLYDISLAKKMPEGIRQGAVNDRKQGSATGISEKLFQSAPALNTPAFKKWFGDSQVVDSDGQPLVVYHQTNAEIEAFDPRKKGAGQFDNETPFGIF